jgi:hypothetical protein
MHEAVKSFELEVRSAVRRGSKSKEFEDSIREVVGHYSDLLQEGLGKGLSLELAVKAANERIGDAKTIGRQILNSPTRLARGLRFQKLGLIGLWVSAIQFLCLEYGALSGWQGLVLSTFGYSFLVLLIVSALSFGLGAGHIKKVLWIPLVASFPGSMLLFAVVRMTLNPIYETYFKQYSPGSIKLTPEPFSFSMALDYGLQYNERLIGSFVVFATFSFLISRIWLMQKSWFRFSWK